MTLLLKLYKIVFGPFSHTQIIYKLVLGFLANLHNIDPKLLRRVWTFNNDQKHVDVSKQYGHHKLINSKETELVYSVSAMGGAWSYIGVEFKSLKFSRYSIK